MKFDLRIFRKQKGLTQKQVAEFLGIGQSFVSQMERGKDATPKETIAKLIDKFGDIQVDIAEIRGQRVMLDFDLAELYQVETRTLKQAVRRNIERFEGDDFMFELSDNEYNALKDRIRSQNVILEIDELVARIKSGLKGGERFRLDFIAYMRQEAARMNSGTASIYMTALNALRRYIGRDTLDIGEITAPFIKGFVQFIESEPSQRGANRKQKGETATKNKGNRALSLYISRIKTIYNRAKEEFNDEELGQMNILGNPFRNLRLETPAPTAKRAISAESIQQIIDLPPLANERARMARDCFLLSFALMGMNSADLLTCPPARKDEIVYFRQKTASRRTDRAEMHVRIEPCVSPLIARYSDKTGKRLLHFYLRYKDRVSFNKAINKGLKDVGEAIGVDGLTFYAARHSWATIARTPREEGGAGLDKYVIHEALNHVDTSMKVTDIYLVKNWRVIFDANKAVMNLFDWSGIGK
jgi:transcriptional regulator with XRE-family HTH domain/integrase